MSEVTRYLGDVEELRAQRLPSANEFASFTGIRSVLDWMQRSGRSSARVEIVGQDEFHYDFMIELEPAGRWVSFGVT